MSGWVLKVEGSILFDTDGEILNIAPLTPVVMVEQGHELESPYIKLCCPSCKHEDMLSAFKPCKSCWLTGSFDNVEQVEFHEIGARHIDPNAVDRARLEDIIAHLNDIHMDELIQELR